MKIQQTGGGRQIGNVQQSGRKHQMEQKPQKYKIQQSGQFQTRAKAVCCVVVSLILYGMLSYLPASESPVTPDGMIKREGYGGDPRLYEIYVDGILEEPVPLTVEVGAKRYTAAEAECAFLQIMDSMEDRIRGENLALTKVRTALTLPTWLGEYGVRLRWNSSNTEILDSFGQVQGGAAEILEECWVTLGVQMAADEFRKEYEIPVRVLPPGRNPQQTLTDGLSREIKKQDEAQQNSDSLMLPKEYAGKKLRYKSSGESGYGVLLLLGVIMAALCYAKEQADVKEQKKSRERELLMDYPELLSKLMVFTGAGMTIRGAWERMVIDYETAVRSGKQRKRAAYEEMGQTWQQLKSGMSEGAAYREFGKRCCLQSYLKLSSLLEQNRKTGTKNLSVILRAEMTDAFEQRKNLARRLGEEAGTKLLLPLFMMLGIVMVMVMVPAMMTMG